MKHWDEIYDIAAGNYGIITTRQAKSVCANADVELPRWRKAGRLMNRGRGVYRLVNYTPTPYDQYAEAVALVGEGSFLHGESVLAINNLALVNPPVIFVASNKRNRRALPNWIKLVPASDNCEIGDSFGIPSQRVIDALRSCKGVVPMSRLRKAAEDALQGGMITKREANVLKGEWK